ncbi:MAG: DUF2974 domain-containing protein [Bacillota bacterium]
MGNYKTGGQRLWRNSPGKRAYLFWKQKNIINYVAEANDSFKDREFNGVDSLILSQLAYLHYDDFVPGLSADSKPVSIRQLKNKDGIDRVFQRVRGGKKNKKLFAALLDSPRFGDMELTFYVNSIDIEKEKQFSAITFLLNDETAYIAYRGTDSTFVGWKEDFNMTFISPIPAQIEGVKYLNTVGELMNNNIRLGGHSKGGNIAIYSSVNCHPQFQNRVIKVFSHDSPGFKKEFLQNPSYFNMQEKIHKYLPQSALVGMLSQEQEDHVIIKSNRFWIAQHDPYSWVVNDQDFRYLETIKNGAMLFNEILNEWIDSFEDEKKELFVNTLFQVIYATEATTIYDLTKDWHKKAIASLAAIRGIDNETRKFVLQAINLLFAKAIKKMAKR